MENDFHTGGFFTRNASDRDVYIGGYVSEPYV